MGGAEARSPFSGSLRVYRSYESNTLPGQEGDQGDGRKGVFNSELRDMSTKLKVKIREKWYTVEVEDLETRPVRVLVDGVVVDVQIDGDKVDSSEPEGPSQDANPAPRSQPAASVARPPSPVKVFRSPMPGVIVSVAVKVGDQVVTGDVVCVLEAMKMQQSLRADWSGIVTEVRVQAGQQVQDGDSLVELG